MRERPVRGSNEAPVPPALGDRMTRRGAWTAAILGLVAFVVLAEVLLTALLQGRLPGAAVPLVATAIVIVGAVLSGLVVVGFLEAKERAIARESRALEERSRQMLTVRGGPESGWTDLDPRASLQRVLDTGRRLVRARYAALAVVGQDQRVQEVVSDGPDGDERGQLDLALREVGLLNAIDHAAAALRIDDVSQDPWVTSFIAQPPPIKTFLGVPVTSAGVKLGLLYCADKLGPDNRPVSFSSGDAVVLGRVATEAAVILATSRTLRAAPLEVSDGEEVGEALRAERERIGMELHDGVIQSMYALGLGLEATIQALETDVPLARTRLIQARDTINNTIQEIRNYIVGLRAEPGGAPTLATRFADVAEELSLTLAADVSPDVERSLTVTQRQQLYLIGREALINVAKHARATQVNLSLVPVSGTRDRGAWILRIWDNGVGFAAGQVSATSFGLQTMRERARLLGGKLTVASRPGQGTEVRLVVPGGTEQEA
jgi:signal transduction histidine kinase